MRVVIQRVREASVSIDGNEVASIGNGLMILLGIEHDDTTEDIEWLCGKITKLRIFDDENKVMNLSLIDTKGEALVVSQFTLHASIKKGNRPSYILAARPEIAIPLYEEFVSTLSQSIGNQVKTGEFGAMMDISLVNQGPVTILIDSKKRE
jgi:D-tyrosyl-tRNA(Tyr) deacylase